MPRQPHRWEVDNVVKAKALVNEAIKAMGLLNEATVSEQVAGQLRFRSLTRLWEVNEDLKQAIAEMGAACDVKAGTLSHLLNKLNRL